MYKSTLIELAKIFQKSGAELFLVGGAVRNSLLNLPVTDLDVASKLKNEEIEKILKDSSFTVKEASKKLGTIIIKTGKLNIEHTTFREEEYESDKSHSPSDVKFIDSLEKDAYRRDFTINSLYQNILTEEIFDIYKGKKDCKNKLIRQIHKNVFDVDALRILRAVRFSSELGFKIERKTFQNAKSKANNIKYLSTARLSEELFKTINSDKKYGNASGAVMGIKYLIKLNVFPKSKLVNFSKRPDIYNLCFDLFRLNLYKINNFVQLFLISKTESKHIFNAINFAINFNSTNSIISFLNNREYIDITSNFVKKKELFNNYKNLILTKQLPLTIKELDINGNDLIKLNYKDEEVGALLNNLLYNALTGIIENKKEKIISFIKERKK